MARILIFEDDIELAEHWKTTLEESGHRVEWVIDLDKAMGILYRGGVDIALIDIFILENNYHSPRGGIMLISKIVMSNLEPKPWLIAVSGSSHSPGLSILEVAKNVGADEYLQKPVEMSVLLSTLDRVIATRSSGNVSIIDL